MSSGNLLLLREDGFTPRRGGRQFGSSVPLCLCAPRFAQIRELPSPAPPTPPKRPRRLEVDFAKAGGPHVQRGAISGHGLGSPTSESEIQGYRISRKDQSVPGIFRRHCLSSPPVAWSREAALFADRYTMSNINRPRRSCRLDELTAAVWSDVEYRNKQGTCQSNSCATARRLPRTSPHRAGCRQATVVFVQAAIATPYEMMREAGKKLVEFHREPIALPLSITNQSII